MLTFIITADMEQKAHHIKWEAQFYNRASLTGELHGTSDELRSRLQPEYRQHLLMVVDDFVTATDAALQPLVSNELQRVLRTELDHLHGCHIALAKDLLLHEDDLKAMVPHTDNRDRLLHHFEFVMQTITQMAKERESLWVRGPIETLDGETIYPWEKTAKAA